MITLKNIITPKFAENVQTSQYTAVNLKTSIDKFTVTNVTASAVTFSANILASGVTASNSNLIISAKSIAAGETYMCSELINKLLDNGWSLSTIASSVNSLVIAANGREFT